MQINCNALPLKIFKIALKNFQAMELMVMWLRAHIALEEAPN